MCPYSHDCPIFETCDKAHNIFENFYHPLKYKTSQCDKIVPNLESDTFYCIRGERCAYYHDRDTDRRIVTGGPPTKKGDIEI